ncbi:S-layer homology domain-containing protein [Paenibacillus sp. NPDC057934]|uniref:S-layer homology domain-containing protein n=1 Tax=Paenibacillus sp. NPDC057934 TaxID=3346282 RepID=UPI0036DC2BCB
MTLKKKLAVSTLAVSLATASFAGIPFSSEGLAKQFGFTGVAAASAVTTKSAINERIQKVYDNVTTGEALYKYKQQALGLNADEFYEIFAPVLDKLVNTEFLNTEDVATSYELFRSASSVVYDVYTDGTDVIKDKLFVDKNIELLNKIAKKAGVASLSFDDFSEFIFGANGVEAELRKLLDGKDPSQVLKDKALLKKAVQNVLERKVPGNNSLTVSQVVYNLGITSEEVYATVNNIREKLDTAEPAALTLGLAYLKAYPLDKKDNENPNPGTSTPGGSGSDFNTGTPAQVVIKEGGVYDVSKLVSIVDGKATLKLVDADVLKAIDALVAANKEAKTLTLDLGTVNAKTVEVPLSKAIIEAAKAKGIANIAVTFNGLTVTIPVGQFDAAIALTVSNVDDAVVTSVTQLKLASSVYEFGLTVDGKAVTTFKQPITLKLPLKNTEGLDKELLSVTKLVYSSLQFQGGVLDGDYIVKPRDTFSSYAVLENKVSFSDIASVQAWAGRQIQVVAAKGVIEGVGDGKFAPKSNVTRAEFAKMLIRGLNLENSSATQTFSDVKANDWFAPYVAVAAEKGIINGRGDNKFDPSATITRAEMATMISRALKSVKDIKDPASLSALSAFSDAAKISSSLKEGVAFAASHDLVIGNAGKFSPNNSATRAEAAVIIYRTINFK